MTLEEDGRHAPAPVVEVSAQDHGIGRGQAAEPAADLVELLVPASLREPEVETHDVQLAARPGHLDDAVEQAPVLHRVRGQVLVIVGQDRKLAQDDVAVMSARVDRVPSVGVVRPDGVRQELELRPGRRRVFGLAEVAVIADDFLQQREVRVRVAQRRPELVEDELAIERREPLVDVVGEDLELHREPRLGR